MDSKPKLIGRLFFIQEPQSSSTSNLPKDLALELLGKSISLLITRNKMKHTQRSSNKPMQSTFNSTLRLSYTGCSMLMESTEASPKY